jgi:hypothetical protein
MSSPSHGTHGSEHVTAADLDKLRHMLGVTPKTPHGYRNYFVAGPADRASMGRLVACGFAECSTRNLGLSGYPCYHATLEGANAVGVKELPR